MQIIPVIDLKDGQVVHAVRGDRVNYQPIHLNSKLTASSDLDAVMAGFMRLYPFRTFYIADLNAIDGHGDHNSLIENLVAQYRNVNFWVDAGRQIADISPTRLNNYRSVIGTESQRSLPSIGKQDFILSLDFKDQKPLGDPAWFGDAALWPENVIVMTLSRVGSGNGPDFQKLMALRQRHPEKNFIAAGGIRDGQDMMQLSEIGINAALVATALHTGSLLPSDTVKF